MDPAPFTLARLWQMAEGRMEQEWNKTSSLLSMIHNVNCSKKRDMRTPAMFNPYATKEQKRLKRPGDVMADTTVFKKLLPLAKAAAKDKSKAPSKSKRRGVPLQDQ